jgi:hypothetical protein
VIFFYLLASVGALAKSKQFGAMGDLSSGRHGSSKKWLLLLAIGLMFFGVCACFVGVGAHDAAMR